MHHLAAVRQRRLAQAIVCVLAAAPLAMLAPGALAQDVELGNLGDRGFRIDGINADDRSGISVSGAGDVNGDGLADLIVGANGADAGGDNNAGESYVVFGKADSAPVNLAIVDTAGFRIEGIDAGDYAGRSVSGAGDVNGDGLADLIVGARGADPAGGAGAGESYVVFGKSDGAPVDLADLAAGGGFGIVGIAADDFSGFSVSGAGDVNGDGLADLIVGARNADPGGNSNAGESYVVFGKADSAPVDLASLDPGGFPIRGAAPFDRAGHSVAGAGDVNGDGLADLVVGAYGVDPAGATYVVFGKASSTPVDLAKLGNGGFRINGINAGDFAAFSVAGAGDVNGDGLADLIIGALSADVGGDVSVGQSYVVFGKASDSAVDLANLGTGGFLIDGADPLERSGFSVAGAGDFNGDGLADLIIGTYGAGPSGAAVVGESYLVFGKSSNTLVDLATLGSGGFRLNGVSPSDFSGFSVAGAGDVNGDGLADLIVGARGADPNGTSEAGESYVVFSASVPLVSAVVRGRSANGDPVPTAFGITGDGSNHSSPDARAWIDFADGSDPAALASSDSVTLFRSTGAFPSPGAGASWRIQTTREEWTSAEVRFRYTDNELFVAESELQLVYSANGQAPFLPLASVVNVMDNTITANITQAGFFHIGQRSLPPDIFSDGFEPAPPPIAP